MTGNISSIHRPFTIAPLTIALALLPAFVFWVSRQERLGKPAIIPNSIWRNKVFTSICIDVFLVWGSFNATETLTTFFFQDVQSLSATQTSLRFLPAPVTGLLTNVVMGLLVHRMNADWAVVGATTISCISPCLLAVIDPHAPYWAFAFPAMALNVIGSDVLYTVSNLVITAAFPDKTQALAGAVFNTIAQIGKSVGLALTAVIAGSVTLQSEYQDKSSPPALLEGYCAAWWYCLAVTLTTLFISLWGLRYVGKLGFKKE
jgi:Na+/melibiose symporter-like transporter